MFSCLGEQGYNCCLRSGRVDFLIMLKDRSGSCIFESCSIISICRDKPGSIGLNPGAEEPVQCCEGFEAWDFSVSLDLYLLVLAVAGAVLAVG